MEERPIEGKYYTVTETGTLVMIGLVTKSFTDECNNSIRGEAIFLYYDASGWQGMRKNSDTWCYKDRSLNRTFRRSTFQEIRQLRECMKKGKFVPFDPTPLKVSDFIYTW